MRHAVRWKLVFNAVLFRSADVFLLPLSRSFFFRLILFFTCLVFSPTLFFFSRSVVKVHQHRGHTRRSEERRVHVWVQTVGRCVCTVTIRIILRYIYIYRYIWYFFMYINIMRRRLWGRTRYLRCIRVHMRVFRFHLWPIIVRL